jgi:hypothetical protein
MTDVRTRTPYTLVSSVEQPVEVTKRELIRLSREIESEALADLPPAVAATLQDSRYVTERTRGVYARLAEAGCPARLFARGVQSWLAPGVTGVPLDDDDPLVDEWAIVVPGSSPVLFAAADLHGAGDDEQHRQFRYALTRDPALVQEAAEVLGIPPGS